MTMQPTDQSTLLLAASAINSYYDRSHILHDVDIVVRKGESVGLLGRNGMGKTTLIKSCLGLLDKVSGEVRLDGVRVDGWTPERIARRGVGYVAEGRGIFPSLSVKENLVVSARAGRDGRRAWTLDNVLCLFPRLAERLNHGGDQLSGGEQQMLAIGRALMTNPELRVIDEVTEGLAPLVMKEIWATVSKVQKAGMACLLVDRNFQSILQSTQHCYFMEKGRIVWAGKSADALGDRALLERFLGV
jgi:branched-chain amino acid transport system ATP-binding protein